MNKWQRLIQVLVAGIMLVALCGASPAAVPAVAATRAQPQLLQMAAAQPSARLSVIVQKADKTDQAEKLVAAVGGAVTKDLHIINAFAAELPASAVLAVAQAAGVRWVSLDAPVVKSGGPDGTVNTASLLSVYDKAIGADKVWAMGYQGSSVTVAVVDSGICAGCGDLLDAKGDSRYADAADLRTLPKDMPQATTDVFGHGTLVAGILGANGAGSKGQWIGVAPKVRLIGVRVAYGVGGSLASDVVAGLQWVLDHKTSDNIRVVNLSLNSLAAESYDTSPLDAACEILWFNGIVVVVSAGNKGSAALYPPANDPFVITVGSADDKGTGAISDDTMAGFSAYGVTESGFAKPELVAPGVGLVSFVPGQQSVLYQLKPKNRMGVDGPGESYMRVSGTSFSAPMVAGAAALLLQANPNLNPDQVKYRLMATANKKWAGYSAAAAGAGYLDVYAALKATTKQSANTGTAVSRMLTTGPGSVLGSSVSWSSVSWSSVSWSSVSWSSVSWSSVSWSSVSWSSDYWEP